jgi:hypothetical protein
MQPRHGGARKKQIQMDNMILQLFLPAFLVPFVKFHLIGQNEFVTFLTGKIFQP